MSSDSWEAFAEALRAETELLARIDRDSIALTEALVRRDAARIEAVNRRLEANRLAHHHASVRRQTMQRRGFGEMALHQVIDYAPRKLKLRLRGYFSELSQRAISIQITTRNNKGLILAGMDRLLKVVSLLQRATAEQPRTYKRRGFVPPPDNSVLVSRKA